jgi:hypothetical protein
MSEAPLPIGRDRLPAVDGEPLGRAAVPLQGLHPACAV